MALHLKPGLVASVSANDALRRHQKAMDWAQNAMHLYNIYLKKNLIIIIIIIIIITSDISITTMTTSIISKIIISITVYEEHPKNNPKWLVGNLIPPLK